MKKLALLFIVIIFGFSCKKEKDPATTYQVINNCTLSTSTVQYLDGSIYQVVVMHYNGTDIIKQDNFTKIVAGGGKSEMLTVPMNSQKMKLSFKFLPPESPLYSSSENHYLNVTAYTTVVQGQNNTITIDDHTIVGEGIGKSNIGNEVIIIGGSLAPGVVK